MKILAVDTTTEAQSRLAARLKEVDGEDLESLDITINLADPDSYISQLHDFDVLMLGPGLGDAGQAMARHAKEQAPRIQVILVVTDERYRSGAFRLSPIARVRKVLPESSTVFDIMQELVSIDAEYHMNGEWREGRVVMFVQAKGGVGVTTLCAALAEVCSNNSRRTLLWDMDIETRDLSRGLTARGPQSRRVETWVNGTVNLTRESFKQALLPISEYCSLLMPPDSLAAAIDLVSHPDLVPTVQRITDLARLSHDNVIIDCAGRMGAATGALLHVADEVVVVIDDSVLGLTAAHTFISTLQPVLPSSGAIRIVCSGTQEAPSKIVAALNKQGALVSETAIVTPSVPFDVAAEDWPGAGKTLYSVGRKGTRAALDKIARRLQLVTEEHPGMVEKDSVVSAAKGSSRSEHRSGMLRAMFQRRVGATQ